MKETIRNNQKFNENAKENKDKDENKYKTIKLKTNRKLKIKIKSRTPAISVAPMVAPHTSTHCRLTNDSTTVEYQCYNIIVL